MPQDCQTQDRGRDVAHASSQSRSSFHQALKAVAQWPVQDRRLFAEIFLSHKTNSQVAVEMGLSPQEFHRKQRHLIRRFMNYDVPASVLAAN